MKKGNDICLIKDMNPINTLKDLDILEQIDDYYIYSDNLIKFFCHNLWTMAFYLLVFKN